MEGDAGTSQLNLADEADEAGTEVTVEAPQMSAEEVSEAAVDEPVNVAADPVAAGPDRAASRLGRRRTLIGVCVVLLLLAAAVATGGYFASRAHRDSQAVARDNAEAIAAAKDCVAATQAPDVNAVAAAQVKIVECGTGDFGAQAALYSGMVVQAYQAANVHVQMSEMRAAVERDNSDGSIDLLVALRIKVDNVEAQGQEFGYRLRVKMAREDGQYKISKLDQVAG